MSENSEALLPLTPAVFHIMLALGDVERHGYSLMQEIAQQTDGRVRIGPGTLYRSLKQMLRDGLVIETDERPAPEFDNERRRYYRITDLGRRVTEAEARRLATLVGIARGKGFIPALDPPLSGGG